MNIYVVSPTYKKFDLCAKMIRSCERNTLKPTGYIILDNANGKCAEYWSEQYPDVLALDNLELLVSEHNLGCEPAWNVLLERIAATDKNALAIVVNDDVELGETDIEDMRNSFKFSDDVVCAETLGVNAFSLWMCNPYGFLNTFGPFDETLSPAYHADNDMHYRMKLLGHDLLRVKLNATHNEGGSATIATYSEEEKRMHHWRFSRNAEYYRRKWGGDPGKETFVTPFNGKDIMHIMMEIYQQFRM